MTMSKMKISGSRAWIYLGTIAILLLVLMTRQQGLATRFWLNEADVVSARSSLFDRKAELHDVHERIVGSRKSRAEFYANSTHYWIDERDSDPENELHSRIEQAAKLTDVKLTSLGSIRTLKAAENILILEASLVCSGRAEAIPRFLAEISRARPAMQWANCAITSESINQTDNLRLNGTIRVVRINDPGLIQFLRVGRKVGDND